MDRPTVLVVDDDADSADIHAQYLDDDYMVRTAYSGEEALGKLDADVGVVLLDRRMLEMSGDEVLMTIREGAFDPRVVLVSAVSPDVETLNLPFDDYMVKPVSRSDVRDAVERMRMRNTCDETIRGIVALASKMATLESKMSISELEASSVYTTLETQLAELRSEDGLGTFGDDDYAVFTDEKLATLLG